MLCIRRGGQIFLPAQLTQADFQKLTQSMEKNQTFLVADHA